MQRVEILPLINGMVVNHTTLGSNVVEIKLQKLILARTPPLEVEDDRESNVLKPYQKHFVILPHNTTLHVMMIRKDLFLDILCLTTLCIIYKEY